MRTDQIVTNATENEATGQGAATADSSRARDPRLVELIRVVEDESERQASRVEPVDLVDGGSAPRGNGRSEEEAVRRPRVRYGFD